MPFNSVGDDLGEGLTVFQIENVILKLLCDCSLIVLFKSDRDCHVGDVLGHLMEIQSFSEQRTSVVDWAVEPCYLDDQRIGKYASPLLIT